MQEVQHPIHGTKQLQLDGLQSRWMFEYEVPLDRNHLQILYPIQTMPYVRA